jgi:hypothetical protein
MRSFFFALTLLVVAAPIPVTAQEKPKPNTLTPKEIADGWILLFDGETTFGLNVKDAKPAKGELVFEAGKPGSITTTTEFRDFELRFEIAGVPEIGQKFFIKLNGTKYDWVKKAGKDWTEIGIKVESGRNFIRTTSKIAGDTLVDKDSSDVGSRTTIEFITTGVDARLRNIKLKPINQSPIFNGKDLTGWKEIPGKKSKFTVTDKGELNVKNGNGDLQTTGEWDDFVLQLDIISNGKHLNSGVFFRCLPGEFWSGYEAQIRNQWQGDDRTKPVDYGTGAIYNRQAARKVVSNDSEWFTMTVIAHGSHLATWVNGYQVTDFTDTRPADKSARKGLKLDKGPISLQGHDPTTDLSFRNIRIEAMPRPVAAKP